MPKIISKLFQRLIGLLQLMNIFSSMFNVDEIMLKLVQCFISHVTTALTARSIATRRKKEAEDREGWKAIERRRMSYNSAGLGCRGEAEAVCKHCLQISTAETTRIRKFPQSINTILFRVFPFNPLLRQNPFDNFY